MIIGGSKKEVINNIKKNIENNELNKKVEIGDPHLSEEEIQKYIDAFYIYKIEYITNSAPCQYDFLKKFDQCAPGYIKGVNPLCKGMNTAVYYLSHTISHYNVILF